MAKTEGDRRAAEDLLALWAHFGAAEADGTKARRTAAYQRLVREIGFTLLNRLAALRLCEERGLLVECVRRGMASDGFQLYERLTGGALGNRYQTYRAFLENLFDELALDLGVLFDRSTPQSLVFPSEAALTDVLALLNDPELAAHDVWRQDETIGWVYQYYNDPKERRAMRDASQAPRNSRELAVRNQFFTPRYVVEFLTDNTLGRTWYEMRQGDTRLAEQCRYLVRRPNEVFLQQGEDPPQDQEKPSELSQEELLEQPVYIPYRPTKDPRDLKILDPACGSGHFLLHSFDLLTVIYEEAWTDPYLPPFSETGTKLADDYPDLGALRRAIPGLVLRHNLHGIDIDPRAVQIAALALWLRAQRAYQDLGLAPAERPRITRTNLVTAEPMPGDRDLLDEFVRALRPRVLGDLVRVVFEKMELAGEAGSLLKIEEELAEAIAEARQQWASASEAEQLALFPEYQRPKPEQLPLFDVSGISDVAFWETAEERTLQALRDYATRVENGRSTRRRLFAEDAAQGFAFVDLCRKRYDVVLINPPFGDTSRGAFDYIESHYIGGIAELASASSDRGVKISLPSALVGVLSPRAVLFNRRLEAYRVQTLIPRLYQLLDLGQGVLDSAMIEVCAFILRNDGSSTSTFINLSETDPREFVDVARNYKDLSSRKTLRNNRKFLSFSYCRILYDVSHNVQGLLRLEEVFTPNHGNAIAGLRTFHDFRFLRLWWEVDSSQIGLKKTWNWFPKGGDFETYYYPVHLLVKWNSDGGELQEHNRIVNDQTAQARQGSSHYGKLGATYIWRSHSFCARALPKGTVFSNVGPVVLPADPANAAYQLGWLCSELVRTLISHQAYAKAYTPGILKKLPWVEPTDHVRQQIGEWCRESIRAKMRWYSYDETTPLFVGTLTPFQIDRIRQLRNVLDCLAREYDSLNGIVAEKANLISQGISGLYVGGDIVEYPKEVSSDDHRIQGGLRTHETNLSDFVSFLFEFIIGSIVGRWDIRFQKEPVLTLSLPDPFGPLPVCPPGMLVSPDGLPATPGHIVSEAWLRARPDAITLPPEGSFAGPATIPDSAYPIPIAWDSILVDDPGLGEHPEPHPSDIARRVREVLAVLWPDNHDAIEAEACEILGVRELRDYFRKPSGFFADHLKRYSKSRRKAPIYWPLSTASGSYTLWLSYHRLDDQILYTADNRYVTPKIEQVEGYVARLEADLAQATGRAASNLRDQLDQVRALLAELREFRQELLRIAGLPYEPNLNDGVIINAAPLHRLFGLRKWAKETEAVWKKLEAGEYDWAHIAYTLWPDRVREVCKRDRSIAIAHGLEHLCEVPEKTSKKKGKKKRKTRKTEPAITQAPLDPDTSVETAADALLAALQSTDEPLSKAGLLECSRIEADQWNAAIKSLLAAEKIKRTGKGRDEGLNTRWYNRI